MNALITSANSLKALVVVRSLGKQGIEVTTGDKTSFSLSSYSKYSSKSVSYPSPQKYPLNFITSLTEEVSKNKYDVLIPVHSEDTYLIAKHKSKLEPYVKVPLHNYSTIINVNDKGYLMKVAENLGIRVPKTFYPTNLNELDSIVNNVNFPLVIKLRNSSSSIGLSYVYSKEELLKKYEETILKFNLSSSEYPLIQEYIEGEGYGVSLLYNQGSLRAKFTHKRLREYPISGGPSTYRISVKHPKMEKLAIKLLDYFKWHGVAMVEFKLDKKNNEPVLMEINPRFWGSINQAVQSGVDFPYLLYTMAVEGDVKPVFNYKVGIKTRNMFIDSVAILKYFQKTKNLNFVKEFFPLYVKDDVFSFNDLLPSFKFIQIGINEMINSRYK
ncbi:carboxylate--amine ligase [Methanosarcina barkeri]|uniref:ATP-grasp protein n=1 Tax=Methanosarcina barkeri CM1 TaxID=796385 RepID=A0A0G3CCX1_METBA|nr:ATP-grasp domain-containing protein [Methanosarcina barkeri]AKJ39836.1 ATP-grasp protein [Methanosarcina barkeri CM1]